nr:hypothetical protein [Bacteroides stercoris]
MGHRKSIDLDFFGTVDCEAEYLRESIAGIASLTILTMQRQTLCRICL